jgi:hypothetical protein
MWVFSRVFEKNGDSSWLFGGQVVVRCVASVKIGCPEFGDEDHATHFRFILRQRKGGSRSCRLL